MKAAIYARYSTDLQDARSIDDQVALCRSFAEREGLPVSDVFADAARSGASVIGRDGLMAMMDAARASRFSVVIVEALDRLSRDQEDLAGLYKRLTFFGVEIRAVHDGRADAVQIGVRGLLGQLYLSDLAHKVRRGLAGRVREGRSAGGRAYGYRPKAGEPGVLEIDAGEAAIVRRIFERYLAGDAPRVIATSLNRDGIPPPRGKFWNASTLNGNRARGTGILENRLYRGELVWNKVRMVKDPETGKRVSRPNPVSEWQRIEAPQLMIVEPALFDSVQALRPDRGSPAPMADRRARKHLLSGLLVCGSCGSGMAVHDRDRRSNGKRRIRCVRQREGGGCDHTRTYYLEAIERVVLKGLKENLRSPALIAEYVKAYSEERRRLAAASIAGRGKRERRLAEVTRMIERALDAICEGRGRVAEHNARIDALGAEKDALTAELAAPAPTNVITLHPQAVRRYLAQIEDLAGALSDERERIDAKAAQSFRALVEKVIVHPVPAREPLDIEIVGYLAALTEAPGLPPQGRFHGLATVAEARYRLYPMNARFGLRLAG